MSCALGDLTPWRVRDAFEHQQGIIVRGALYRKSVQNAHHALTRFFNNDEELTKHPYDEESRLGYTPPGIETIQRDPDHPDENRAMFDFGPELPFVDRSITGLRWQAVRICKRILDLLDEAYGTRFARLPEGEHRLRAAQYLRDGTTSQEVLFPRHRDFSLLTAFVGANEAGLEAEVMDEWYPVRLDYGDVLIGAGTPLRQFHPSARALWHRIVGGTDRRLSSFLFYELRSDVILPQTLETYGAMLDRVMKSIRA
ncbi:MAG TPA: 2OG-Fe(II) oxygenase family protein [Candidatus Paceibacterota bacterium]|nr:2OG-Fe(II) oxygenase family protein [Candidatus Paceibacterota bacterium]